MNTPAKNWEIRLTAVHSVVLVGLVTGSMAAAFFLGFESGRRVGFEVAQNDAMVHAPRIPIPSSELDEEGAGEIPSKVYDQLASAQHSAKPSIGLKDDLPQLGKIAVSNTSPSESEQALKQIVREGSAASLGNEAMAAPSAAQLGANTIHAKSDDAAEESDTLGALSDEPPAHVAGIATHNEKMGSNPVVAAKAPAVALVVPTLEPLRLAPTALPTVVVTKAVFTAAPIVHIAPTAIPHPTVAKVVVSQSTSTDLRIKGTPPKGWYVQIAAPKRFEDANDVATRLKRAGFAAKIETASVRGQDYFRIIVGPEADRDRAERILGQVKKSSGVPGEPFLRAVR